MNVYLLHKRVIESWRGEEDTLEGIYLNQSAAGREMSLLQASEDDAYIIFYIEKHIVDETE